MLQQTESASATLPTCGKELNSEMKMLGATFKILQVAFPCARWYRCRENRYACLESPNFSTSPQFRVNYSSRYETGKEKSKQSCLEPNEAEVFQSRISTGKPVGEASGGVGACSSCSFSLFLWPDGP